MTSSTNPLAGRDFRDETGAVIVPGRKLGEGGEGAVYLVEGDPGSVMKVWHPGRTPRDADVKIRHLVNNPVVPDLGATWHITWPQSMIMEDGVIVGYTMSILNPDEFWEPIVDYYNRRAAESTGVAQGRDLRIDDRVRMARNLAMGFRAVHRAGYVIGDVNEKNVEVNRQNDIAMVDCDSYGFTDAATGRTFSNRMARPEFQSPEAQGNYANRTQNHDLFGLAVIIFHLLTGYHPYTVTNQPNYPLPGDRISAWLFPPARGGNVTAPDQYNEAWDSLTDQQKELFLRCFDKTCEGQPRPAPEEWVEALMEMPDRPTPAPTPAPPPRPRPTPARPTPPRPTPGPSPGRRSTVPSPDDIDDRLHWVLAVAGYAALLPLTFFSEFRPFWWLSLTLAAALLFFLPIRRLLQPPITSRRWVLIVVALFFGVILLLSLIEAVMRVWPWWLWLAAALVMAFVFLGPGRNLFRGPNPWKRRISIGAVVLGAVFILINLILASLRDGGVLL